MKMTTCWAGAALTLSCLLAAPAAQAGVLEDLLATPAIQNLLGRLPDLQSTVKRCADAKFREKNTAACQQADQAARLASIPPELRGVLAVPAASTSLRDVCLVAQGGPRQDSYLCAELYKADPAFKTQADQQRVLVQQRPPKPFDPPN